MRCVWVGFEGHYSLEGFTAGQNHKFGSLLPTADETQQNQHDTRSGDVSSAEVFGVTDCFRRKRATQGPKSTRPPAPGRRGLARALAPFESVQTHHTCRSKYQSLLASHAEGCHFKCAPGDTQASYATGHGNALRLTPERAQPRRSLSAGEVIRMHVAYINNAISVTRLFSPSRNSVQRFYEQRKRRTADLAAGATVTAHEVGPQKARKARKGSVHPCYNLTSIVNVALIDTAGRADARL
ncbi:hypothetical protein EVAR_53486_1 [Eumeta japonica]|uniref:Uncharacterized protein n=1 Tax=Eumeta variegata TaxID=151549 RepID=A0A4C1YWA6_EUMVA|nr:hypothetical protein EVAR_53486_1 [Eumeta japonica]